MTEQAKECTCGSKNLYIVAHERVVCRACKKEGPKYFSHKQAIKAWNAMIIRQLKKYSVSTHQLVEEIIRKLS